MNEHDHDDNTVIQRATIKDLDDDDLAEMVEQDQFFNDGLGVYQRVSFDGEYLTVHVEYPNGHQTCKVWVVEPRAL